MGIGGYAASMAEDTPLPDLTALPPAMRAFVEARAAALAQERQRAEAETAARRHLEAEIADHRGYIERLEHLVRELQRARFGPRSEKLHPDQLALALEDLETAIGEVQAAAGRTSATTDRSPGEGKKRPPRALPKELPRIERVIEPKDIRCPCGCGQMVNIGEDRTERLDIVPAQFRVVVTIRPRYACPKGRAGVVQAPAPAHLIEGGLPTEALVAYVAVAKFADYLPLYRQTQLFARHGVELDRSTLADWVGHVAHHVAPIVERMTELLKTSGKLFMDETTVPVLDPGRGRTKTGYLWAMARDDRPPRRSPDLRSFGVGAAGLLAAAGTAPTRQVSSSPTRPGAAASMPNGCSPASTVSSRSTPMPVTGGSPSPSARAARPSPSPSATRTCAASSATPHPRPARRSPRSCSPGSPSSTASRRASAVTPPRRVTRPGRSTASRWPTNSAR